MDERGPNPALGPERAPQQEPTALLIGSYKFEKERPVRGVPEGLKAAGRLRRKGGRKKAYTKAGVVPPEAFVEGDLRNMERYIHQKEIHRFSTVDYREHDTSTGEYAGGKDDILNLVRDFFAQDDRTEFILYFTGHGDVDGSWCIPVTVLKGSEEEDGSVDVTFQPTPVLTRERSGTPSPVPKPAAARAPDIEPVATASIAASSVSAASSNRKVPPTEEYFDLVTYDDIVQVWDEEKRGRERRLMMILDCCHSGRWVQMVDGKCRRSPTEVTDDNEATENSSLGSSAAAGASNSVVTADEGSEEIVGEITARRAANEPPNEDDDEDEPEFYEKRDDICIQAACRPIEDSMIASNQRSSFFTRAFVAAQSKTTFEKFCFTFFDHVFVFNVTSFLCSPILHPFTPMKSDEMPFAGIQFFDSFDGMYLETP
ncbi:hypothetical protein GBAR_LOCUS13890 [Geodia barretti]|uniref:Uncharacterized protein n=1 Tax=Geodia barretti TaxID=519541 RepID=A0AA35S6D9_GEOBA|nr:hypothetical protein GBAR_LOCUS13890 [Geodia barretti]